LNRISFGLTLTALAGLAFVMLDHGSRPRPANQEHQFPVPLQALEQLLAAWSQTANADIASMNILCSEGFPNAENLSLASSLATLDR
jgi:hypothetical protein